MPTVTEQVRFRPRTVDRLGIKTRVRRFRIDVPPDNAIEQGLLNGLPAPNSAHPDDPTLLADNISAVEIPENPSQSWIDVLYSNDRIFTFPRRTPQLDPGDPEFQAEGGGAIEVEQPIPFFVKVRKQIVQSEQTRTIDVWEPREAIAREYRDIMTYAAVVPDFGVAERLAIRAETGKIHFIDGQYWQMEPASFRRYSAFEWIIDYRWTLDTGTIAINVAFPDTTPPGFTDPPSTLVAYPTNLTWVQDGNVYLRPPYHRISVIPNQDPEQPPAFIAQTTAVASPNGLDAWQNLPGGPLQ